MHLFELLEQRRASHLLVEVCVSSPDSPPSDPAAGDRRTFTVLSALLTLTFHSGYYVSGEALESRTEVLALTAPAAKRMFSGMQLERSVFKRDGQ